MIPLKKRVLVALKLFKDRERARQLRYGVLAEEAVGMLLRQIVRGRQPNPRKRYARRLPRGL